MKDLERKRFSHSMTGYSFMLTILVILTLVIFSVLSLAASLRDYDYSRRVAEKTTAYYEANSKAYDILERIDDIFAESQTLEEGLNGIGQIPEVTVLTEEEISDDLNLKAYAGVLLYKVDITSNQKLEVMLGINVEESGNICYKVVKWKEVSDDTGESETMLPVFGSE